MKTAKIFDVHDDDITPSIYSLLFSGIVVELQGNDMVYDLTCFVEDYLPNDEWDAPADPSHESNEYCLKLWAARIARGSSNCFSGKGGNAAMKEYVESDPSLNEAIKDLIQYLIDHGVTTEDEVHCKIWW